MTRKVLWYVARLMPASVGPIMPVRDLQPSYTFATLMALREKMVPLMRRQQRTSLPVEVWESIGPHNAVLVKTGDLYADRRVSWYRPR